MFVLLLLPPHHLLPPFTPLRWNSLESRALARNQLLSSALEQARDFHTSWSDLLNRLNEAEKAVLADWKAHSLPEACQADIAKHREVIDKTSALQSAISTLGDFGKGLKALVSKDDQELVNHWLDSVEQQFEGVMARNKERKVCACVHINE